MAISVNSGRQGLEEIDESTGALLRFEGERVAAFVTSFNSSDVGSYRIVGTKGQVRVDPAYEYAEGLAYELTVNGKTTRKRIGKRDQFAAELLYFSDCVLKNREPEPSGEEGMQDVRIVQALYESAETGKAVAIPPFARTRRPNSNQRISRPGVPKPERYTPAARRATRAFCVICTSSAGVAHRAGRGGSQIGCQPDLNRLRRHAANTVPSRRPARCTAAPWSQGRGGAEAERLFAPRSVGSPEIGPAERSDAGGGRDSPVTLQHSWLSTRFVHSRADHTQPRPASWRGRAVFLRLRSPESRRASARPRRSLGEGGRDVDPEQTPRHTAVASTAIGFVW